MIELDIKSFINSDSLFMNILLQSDLYRYKRSGSIWEGYLFRFHRVLRIAQRTNSKLVKIICKLMLRHYRNHYGLEIPAETKIGRGLYLGHAFNITINPNAIIGDNCNIHKGVLIGAENRGKRKGAPKIGNKVWIGINSAIVGNITVGNDVLIAPNSYVNCDVPSHSIVFGNPCIIKHSENATGGYINNIYEENTLSY